MAMGAMEYYSALERQGIWTQSATWLSLEEILLSEESLSQKDRYCIWVPTGVNVTESRGGGWCWGRGEGRGLPWFLGTEFQFGKMKASGDGGGGGCTMM